MTVLIFGIQGSIGSYLAERLRSDGRTVIGTTRLKDSGDIYFDPSDCESFKNLADIQSLTAAIWCQGINRNDRIDNLDYEKYLDVMNANLHFVTSSLNYLVAHGKLEGGSRVLIVSSLWQEFTRNNKFSYTVSKAALGGIVRSCSVDLGFRNILVNAILPGPLDNAMTRQNLTEQQISSLPGFVALSDIYHLSNYLCFFNQSTNGQSIIVDLGFSVRKM